MNQVGDSAFRDGLSLAVDQRRARQTPVGDTTFRPIEEVFPTWSTRLLVELREFLLLRIGSVNSPPCAATEATILVRQVNAAE